MKYLLPNYKRGDRYLRQICCRSHRFTHFFRLCDDPNLEGNKLTYGYLGNIARRARLCQANPEFKPIKNTLIADHGFGPQALRNNIYRLALHDQHIRGLQFSTENLLSRHHKNVIYKYLKTLQETEYLQLLGNFSNTNNHEVGLLIEPAPVLTELQLNEIFNPKHYAENFRKKTQDMGLNLFKSFKRLEISLSREGERKKTINTGEHASINPSHIKAAACPTSMLAICLILKGIPVELSPIHPLIDQLGPSISALSKVDALELTYAAIIKTTFSMTKIRELEKAISNFKPKDHIGSNTITLETN